MSSSFIEVIRQLGKPVTYYPNISNAIGDVRAGIFISNFFYWEGKQKDKEGWIYKSQKEIEHETGMSRYMQETARRKLKEVGILQEKLAGSPATKHYKFNWDLLNEIMANYIDNGDKAETINEVHPVLYEMKLIFDDAFLKNSEGIAYEWDKAKSGGRDWKNLKSLKDYFEARAKVKCEKDKVEYNDDHLFNGFRHFLELIPEYHRQRNFTPTLLYSNINKIVMEIKNDQSNKKPKSSAKDYV